MPGTGRNEKERRLVFDSKDQQAGANEWGESTQPRKRGLGKKKRTYLGEMKVLKFLELAQEAQVGSGAWPRHPHRRQ